MQALWILAAGLCFSVTGAFVKTGAQYFTTSELVFYRSLVSALVMVAMIVDGQAYLTRFNHLRETRYVAPRFSDGATLDTWSVGADQYRRKLVNIP